jgi:FdhE protein
MSIRIVAKEQLGAQREKSTTALSSSNGSIPPLLLANLKSLYSRRAERLHQLAANHPLGDYLNFAASIAAAQHNVCHDNPLMLDLSTALAQGAANGKPPLDASIFPRSTHWHQLLAALIAELRPQAPEHVLPVLENLEKASSHELELMASALLNNEFAKVGSDKAPFIWAALSLYWAQMASQIPGKARAEYGEHRKFCPVCGSMPVSSMVHIGTVNGLRYLHCNLCESEWHVVRVKCTNCEQTRDLNYWSLESEQAAVKAESCGDCGTYLKILYQEQNPQIEAVADDLASLILDAKMEEEGFARSSINPFLFPGE